MNELLLDPYSVESIILDAGDTVGNKTLMVAAFTAWPPYKDLWKNSRKHIQLKQLQIVKSQRIFELRFLW